VTNFVPRQYREVSVASVSFPLTSEGLTAHFLGREVYKRTRYVVVRRLSATAIVSVETAPGSQVMTPVLGVAVIARPDECTFIEAPDTDTGVPSALAAAALGARSRARAIVVEGRYHHINFILDPAPLDLRVVDVVPPAPAKLVDQVARVLAVAEDLPPVTVIPDVVDLVAVAGSTPAVRYLLPCRGSGFGGDVSFLDERPPRQDWTLIGCARSRELHRWFYGDLPPVVDMCPRALAAAPPRAFSAGAAPAGGHVVTLTKCCLLEDRIDVTGDTVVVPWGASLAQIRQGLEAAVGVAAAHGPTAADRDAAPAPANG
jgi:hypothetical protein